MSLSCECPWGGDFDWYYEVADDFKVLSTPRRRRCCSCKTPIIQGELCLEFERYREPRCEVEENIYGDQVYLASWYMCEKCGEQFLNLNAYGYCTDIGENMLDLLQEHREMHGIEIQTGGKNENRREGNERIPFSV